MSCRRETVCAPDREHTTISMEPGNKILAVPSGCPDFYYLTDIHGPKVLLQPLYIPSTVIVQKVSYLIELAVPFWRDIDGLEVMATRDPWISPSSTFALHYQKY